MTIRLKICILFLLIFQMAGAQQITGTWKGEMDFEEILEINAVQVGNKLCGYTWDYDVKNKTSFCKAYFSGYYNSVLDAWFLEGTSFLENSGDHVLMILKFKTVFEDGERVLKGVCKIKPSMLNDGGAPTFFTLKKISSLPAMMTQAMKDCVAQNQPAKKTTTPKKITPKKTAVIPPKKVVIVPNKDSAIAIVPLKDTVIKKVIVTVNNLPKQTLGRDNKELRRIVVNSPKITLNIYDNGTIDGDTVSIYYNGNAILKNKKLTANGIKVDLTLDENKVFHSVVLYAENLGTIPPNTALVIFTTPNGKRYELFSSATLQQNAEIVFEYRPN